MLSSFPTLSDIIRWLIPPLCLALLLLRLLKRHPRPKSPPGTSGWPLLGETLHFLASAYTSGPLSFMHHRSSLYGRVFRTNILGSEVIVSADAEVNKVILQNQGNVFVPAYPKSVRELMGQHSILQINGNPHRKLHYLIAGFLRSPLLKSRITSEIQRSVTLCLASWNHHPPVYVQDQVKKITFTILVRVLISMGPGAELEALRREFEEFIKALVCVPIKFPGTRLYKSLKSKERMMKRVRKIVEERKTAREEGKGGAARDAVDVLLGDEGLSVEAISENIIEMMIPGEETLPTSMTMAVKFLSDSPPALSHLREENMELKRQKTDRGEDYEWTDYMSLPFTQNVISETLRLANIVNAIWRKATKDVEIKGYLIPKGNSVVASLMSVHMDESMYEKAFEFNPWRWERIEGGGSSSKLYGYSPFGGGQRLCPGMEMSRLELSIFLHHLVTTYTWHAHPDRILYFPTVKMTRKLPISVQPL